MWHMKLRDLTSVTMDLGNNSEFSCVKWHIIAHSVDFDPVRKPHLVYFYKREIPEGEGEDNIEGIIVRTYHLDHTSEINNFRLTISGPSPSLARELSPLNLYSLTNKYKCHIELSSVGGNARKELVLTLFTKFPFAILEDADGSHVQIMCKQEDLGSVSLSSIANRLGQCGINASELISTKNSTTPRAWFFNAVSSGFQFVSSMFSWPI